MTASYNQAIIEEILRQQREAQGSPYQRFKKTVGTVGKTGKNMTAVGDYMKNNLSNPTLQKLGSNISGIGSKLSNSANTVNNVITPQNYFKGFAPKPFAALNNGATGATSGLGASSGMGAGSTLGSSAVGDAIGTEAAGTGSALGGSAIGNAIGAEVGGTAAGAGAGSAVGSAVGAEVGGAAAGAGAGGAAAGGAAAGGSTAGAGAAAGPIGALVALGVMALQGANRKKAKKSGQALLSGLNKESDAALEQTNQFAKNMQNQDYSQPMLSTASNGMAGGAAPITQEDVNAQAYQNYMDNNPAVQQQNQENAITNAINAQMPEQNTQSLGNEAPLAAGVTDENAQGGVEETKRGLLDKFLSGVSDLARGYQENRSEGFNPNNLTADKFTETITNPVNTQKILDYQNQLTNDAAYNDWATRAGVDKAAAIKAIEEGKNSGNADVDNWIKNNQDAYKETQETKTYNKGKMARLGEALGTMGRVAQNPLVQGLVAGGLSAALTGNPLYGLGQGYKFANNRAMSDIYSNALKQYGFDVPNVGMFGNLGSKDVQTIMYPQVEQMKNDRELARLQALNDYRTGQLENQKIRNEISQQNANTNAYKAQNGSKVTHISNGGSKKTGSSSVTGTKNPNYNQALAQYYNILQSGDARKISYARQRFIKEIGIDPDTKIKQTAKKQSSASAPSSDEEAFLREIGY